MNYKHLLSILTLAFLGFTACKSSKTNAPKVDKPKEAFEKGIDVSKSVNKRIAFYNVENLFDTIDDPKIDDQEFLPDSKNQWTLERYQKKLNNLADVFEAMQYPSMIGLAEIENEKVLKDLCTTEKLKKMGYTYVHYDSPDERGVDVAFLYKKSDFTVMKSNRISIVFPSFMPEDKTRDILHINGIFENSEVDIFVNHWPSRRGGQEESEKKRVYVAGVLRDAIDNIINKVSKANIIIMGDFNDEPDNKSIKSTLRAQALIEKPNKREIYNTNIPLNNSGKGSYFYKNEWESIDQIIVSGNLLDSSSHINVSKEVTVFQADFMMYFSKEYNTKLPSHTYDKGKYYGGYSDHLPVFVEVLTH